MSGKTMTMLAMLVFVALTLGSFLWFILTWDKTKEQPVSSFPHINEGRTL